MTEPIVAERRLVGLYYRLAILLLALWGVLPHTPKIAKWTSLAAAFPKGWSTLGTSIVLCIAMGFLTFIGGIWMKYDLKNYIPGFIVLFALTTNK